MARKKCKACGTVLEGFTFKWITKKILGIEESTDHPGYCTRCAKKYFS
jgi:hypothetical protein